MPDATTIMPFGEHLEELRRRLVWALIGIGVLLAVGLAIGGTLMDIVAAPLLAELKEAGQAPSMLATSPLEAFGAYIKVATVFALAMGMPWTLYQAWLFVAPGLYPREQRFAYVLLPLSGALTAAGLLVLYYVILPISLYFLISFGSGLMARPPQAVDLPPGTVLPSLPVLAGDPSEPPVGATWINEPMRQVRVRVGPGRTMGYPLVDTGTIAQQYRVSEYVNLFFLLGLAFGIAFQVPIVLLVLSWAGIIGPADLAAKRRHVILGCVIGAALLPTQDPWSLLLLSGLLVGLFELGIVLMRFVPAGRVAGVTSPSGRASPGNDGDFEAP
jgi:sec-independent protein translocase protein TatC